MQSSYKKGHFGELRDDADDLKAVEAGWAGMVVPAAASSTPAQIGKSSSDDEAPLDPDHAEAEGSFTVKLTAREKWEMARASNDVRGKLEATRSPDVGKFSI